MTSIKIGELNHITIAEIDMNDMSLIRGGTTIGVSPELLQSVPQLEAIEFLVVTETLLNEIDTISFSGLREQFNLVPVVSTNVAPVNIPQLPIRRFPF